MVKDCDWVSKFTLEGKVVKTTDEVGDDGSTWVYKRYLDGKMVAVKQIKVVVTTRCSSTDRCTWKSSWAFAHQYHSGIRCMP